MKTLTKLEINLPVYSSQSVISYQAIRKPTAFEALGLLLLDQHKNTLGQFSLAQVCQVLKIEPTLLKQALDSLFDNDMIESPNKDEWQDIRLQEIKLTNLGKELLRKQQMPSQKRNISVTFYYHPLLQQLLPSFQKSWTAQLASTNIAISAQLLQPNISQIEQLSRSNIEQADERVFTWKKQNTNISEIKTTLDKTYWQPYNIQLSLDSNGHLSVQATGSKPDHQALQQWLQQAEPEVLWQEILSQAFVTVETDLPNIQWQQVIDIAMPNTKINVISPKVSVFIEKSQNTIAPNLEIIMSNQVQQATLQGKTLKVPMIFKPHAGFKALHLDMQEKSFVVFQGNTNIYFAGQPRKVHLQISLADQGIWETVKTRLLQDANLDVLAFARAFLTEQQVIGSLKVLSAKQALDFQELVKKTTGRTMQSTDWIAKIKMLEQFEDIAHFRKVFPQVELTEQHLSKDLLSQLIDAALEKRFFYTVFDDALKKLANVNDALKSRIDDQALKQTFVSQKIDAKKVNFKAIQGVIEWLDAFEKVQNLLPEAIKQARKLNARLEQIQVWQALVDKQFCQKRVDNKQVIVLDTSYLMRHSEELANFPKNQFIVIPQVAIDELNGLKKGNNDEQTEQVKQARRAISLLNDLPPEHFEPSHPELLHSISQVKENQQPSEDMQILSVALYHRLNSAVLYSADKNLNNLAKSVQVQTKM
mgnify:FL=1